MKKVKFQNLPYTWQQLMLIRQAQAGNRINSAVFDKKIDASKSEGGFDFNADKSVRWNDIFYWDGKKDLPECPIPEAKFPSEETLKPSVLESKILTFGGLSYKKIAETEKFDIYATKDTINGMRHHKKSLVLIIDKKHGHQV